MTLFYVGSKERIMQLREHRIYQHLMVEFEAVMAPKRSLLAKDKDQS
jgi:hypothetical protein